MHKINVEKNNVKRYNFDFDKALRKSKMLLRKRKSMEDSR